MKRVIVVLSFALVVAILFVAYYSSETVKAYKSITESTIETAKSEIAVIRSEAQEYGRRCLDIPPNMTGRVENKARVDFYEKEFYHNMLTFRNPSGEPISPAEALRMDEGFTICWRDFEPRTDPSDAFFEWMFQIATNGDVEYFHGGKDYITPP